MSRGNNWLNRSLKKVFGKDAYWHWQNLNERPGNNLYGANDMYGSGWLYGRAWIHFGKYLEVNPEWCLKSKQYGIGMSISRGDGEKVTFTGSFAPISLHLTFGFPYGSLQWITEERCTTSLIFNDWILFINIWNNDYIWESKKNWWKQRNWSIDFRKILFGDRAYYTKEVEKRDAVIPMPEGNYPATVTMFESTWKRPRVPWATRMLRADVTIKDNKCIPHPGKGENSWDCGIDGTYRLTCHAKHVEEAIASMVESVLRSRRKYGGINWQPELTDIPAIVEYKIPKNHLRDATPTP